MKQKLAGWLEKCFPKAGAAWRESVKRHEERVHLFMRTAAALEKMGRFKANQGQVDLVVLRAGVHLLEANAEHGPCFLVPLAQIPRGEGQPLENFRGRLH